jgi:hypothetical protein
MVEGKHGRRAWGVGMDGWHGPRAWGAAWGKREHGAREEEASMGG